MSTSHAACWPLTFGSTMLNCDLSDATSDGGADQRASRSPERSEVTAAVASDARTIVSRSSGAGVPWKLSLRTRTSLWSGTNDSTLKGPVTTGLLLIDLRLLVSSTLTSGMSVGSSALGTLRSSWTVSVPMALADRIDEI